MWPPPPKAGEPPSSTSSSAAASCDGGWADLQFFGHYDRVVVLCGRVVWHRSACGGAGDGRVGCRAASGCGNAAFNQNMY